MRQKILLATIFFLATILRFYNINHDAPYFFDPDERNMANSITQLRLPTHPTGFFSCLTQGKSDETLTKDCNLHPHFFAYGQFPLYLAFFSDQLVSLVTLQSFQTISFSSAIFWLRFYSATASLLTVVLIYKIARHFVNEKKELFASIAALLSACTPGLIQAAHFGTTESLLTFFFVYSFYLSLKLFSRIYLRSTRVFLVKHAVVLLFLILSCGLAIGTKLTGVFCLFPPFFTLAYTFLKREKRTTSLWIKSGIGSLGIGCILLGGSLFFSILSSPYNLIALDDFKSSVFGYEKDVATGAYQAFYTRQFVGTYPLIFQIQKIFPHALGWFIFMFGSLGLVLAATCLALKLFWKSNLYHKNQLKKLISFPIICGLSSFLFYLLPNIFLFTKWTRFMTPIFPFFILFTTYLLFYAYRVVVQIIKLLSRNTFGGGTYIQLIMWIVTAISCLPGIAFASIYTREDTRVQASEWIYQNIPDNSFILSETANVIDIPLSIHTVDTTQREKKFTIISFDFYHLDENPILFTDLLTYLTKAEYLFIPSRRIFANYTRFPTKYPLITKYYQLLFSGALGYDEVNRINSFPTLGIGKFAISWDDEGAEETWTVFDHPVIRIFKKTNPKSLKEYQKLFTQ